MKIMTIYNAKEKAEDRIDILESHLPPSGNKYIWNKLIRAIRQRNKFAERLVALIQKADSSHA